MKASIRAKLDEPKPAKPPTFKRKRISDSLDARERLMTRAAIDSLDRVYRLKHSDAWAQPK